MVKRFQSNQKTRDLFKKVEKTDLQYIPFDVKFYYMKKMHLYYVTIQKKNYTKMAL